MDIIITEEAYEWLKEEFNPDTRLHIKLFPLYGSLGAKHNGYGIGMSAEKPINPGYETTMGNVTIYVENQDTWYFEEYTLRLERDKKTKELLYKVDEK